MAITYNLITNTQKLIIVSTNKTAQKPLVFKQPESKMAFFVFNIFADFLILLITLAVLVTTYFQHCYKYWDRKKVPTIPPRFPLGNSVIFLHRGFTIGITSKIYYDYFKKRGNKFGGIYLMTQPILFITDPDYIKDVLLQDFQHFVDRGFYCHKKADPISANLFTLDGTDWRSLRVKLTPTFTSSKMKLMFQTVRETCDNMITAIEKNRDFHTDIKEIAGRYTIDVIGSCAFGIECNSFKHPDAEFRRMGIKIFQFDFWRSFRAFLIVNAPKLSHFLGLTPNNNDVRNFFLNLVTDTVKLRKESGVARNDFLQILIDLKETANMGIEEMAAQVFLFFLAGFETSSVTISFAVYELARNPDCQAKLRAEILQVLKKHDGVFTYDSIAEMKYLGQVFDETLRFYPPGPTLNRRCNKDYILKDTDIVVPKGTPILMSPFGLHHDPEYYPDPEKFDPERFTEEMKKVRHPYVYLPFGEGPRNCIGSRFGTMQTKLGIAALIRNFEWSVSPHTTNVQLDPSTFVMRPLNTIYLKATKI